MPNWCKGNIRFRGKRENIKQFLLNEIVCCGHENYEIVEYKPIVEDVDHYIRIAKPNDRSWFYIKNTRRNFFDAEILEIHIDDINEEDEGKEIIVCIDDFKVAWSFERNNEWIELAKKYELDVKMTGYECGLLFSQVKTFLRNGRIIDETHEYENYADWMWNCPQPNLGG